MLESAPDFADFFKKNYGLLLAQVVQIYDGNELVFFVQTVDNQLFTLKIFRSAGAPNTARLMEINQFLCAISRQNIAAPIPVLTTQHELISTIFFEEKKRNAALFNWIIGKKITRPTVSFYEKMGKITAKLHEIGRIFEENYPFCPSKTTLTLLDENYVKSVQKWLPEAILAHGFSSEERLIFTQKLTLLAQKLGQWRAKFPAEFGRIHTDLHRGNVLQKNRKLAILDWDELAIGPYLLDLAIIFKDFKQHSVQKQAIYKAAILENYQKNRPPEADFDLNFQTSVELSDLLTATWVFNPQNDFVRANPVSLKFGNQAIFRILG